MKWVFLLMMIVLTPVFISQFRSNPKALPVAGFFIGLSPFIISPLHLTVAPYSWAAWPGTVKGIEISAPDFIAISILLTTPSVRVSKALKFAVSTIYLALFASSLAAEDIMPSLFYVWQFTRTILLCLAVARATAKVADFPSKLLNGYAAGMVYLAISVAIEYGGGDIQAGGAFGHQNLAGLVTMFMVFPAFALLLAGRKVFVSLVILGSEIIVAFGGGSRAAIGLLGAGILLTLVLSIWHRSSGRKTGIAVATLLGVAIATPIMLNAIDRRSEAARQGSVAERRAFEDAASMMVKDHPLGVGANRYVIVANLGGYSDRAGVPWNWSERSAPVHNAYYLIAAEMGALGLVGYVALFAALILLGLRSLRQMSTGLLAELMVGLTASAIVTSIYYAFEWVPMLYAVHCLAAMNAGMMIGLAYAMRAERSAKPAKQSIVRKPAEDLVTV